MFDAERNTLRAKKRAAQFHRSFVSRGVDSGRYGPCRLAVVSVPGYGRHHADQARPVNLGRALQLSRPREAQPWLVRREKDEAGIVEPAAAGAAEHLQKL